MKNIKGKHDSIRGGEHKMAHYYSASSDWGAAIPVIVLLVHIMNHPKKLHTIFHKTTALPTYYLETPVSATTNLQESISSTPDLAVNPERFVLPVNLQTPVNYQAISYSSRSFFVVFQKTWLRVTREKGLRLRL